MRLLILSIGSRGDVQPYVSLARALKAAGYDVAVGVAPGYREFVESHGVEHRSFDCGDPRELLANPETRNAIENGGNPLRFVRKLGEILGPLLEKGYIDACQAARDADAIVAGPGGVPVAQALEESRGVPYVPAFLQPSHPTREFASWLMPEIPRWLPFCGALRRASHHAAFELLFRVIRGANDSARRRVLDLGPGVNGFASMLREAKLTLYGYSEHVVPTPKDWGPNALATGYWFLPQLSSWQAPRALVDFLESGEKPVCIGFGSMTTRDPAGATQLVARACKQARVRAVLLTGWGGLEGADLGDGVFALEAAPHDWLFPRMAGVVHHGGAGTTSAAMRAGVPSFAATFIADQQFWGRRIATLGCGPGPIAFRKLGVDELARRIRALVDTPAYRDGAIEIGRKLRCENGAARAAAALRI